MPKGMLNIKTDFYSLQLFPLSLLGPIFRRFPYTFLFYDETNCHHKRTKCLCKKNNIRNINIQGFGVLKSDFNEASSLLRCYDIQTLKKSETLRKNVVSSPSGSSSGSLLDTENGCSMSRE